MSQKGFLGNFIFDKKKNINIILIFLNYIRAQVNLKRFFINKFKIFMKFNSKIRYLNTLILKKNRQIKLTILKININKIFQ